MSSSRSGPKTCFICHGLCAPEEVVYLRDGRHFHRACFRCTQCQKPLPQKYACKNRKYYHIDCYTDMKSRSPACPKCSEPVLKTEIHFYSAIDNVLVHPSCYTCDVCYYRLGNSMCMAGNRMFHAECYVCSQCGQSLENQAVTEVQQGKFACGTCYPQQNYNPTLQSIDQPTPAGYSGYQQQQPRQAQPGPSPAPNRNRPQSRVGDYGNVPAPIAAAAPYRPPSGYANGAVPAPIPAGVNRGIPQAVAPTRPYAAAPHQQGTAALTNGGAAPQPYNYAAGGYPQPPQPVQQQQQQQPEYDYIPEQANYSYDYGQQQAQADNQYYDYANGQQQGQAGQYDYAQQAQQQQQPAAGQYAQQQQPQQQQYDYAYGQQQQAGQYAYGQQQQQQAQQQQQQAYNYQAQQQPQQQAQKGAYVQQPPPPQQQQQPPQQQQYAAAAPVNPNQYEYAQAQALVQAQAIQPPVLQPSKSRTFNTGPSQVKTQAMNPAQAAVAPPPSIPLNAAPAASTAPAVARAYELAEAQQPKRAAVQTSVPVPLAQSITLPKQQQQQQQQQSLPPMVLPNQVAAAAAENAAGNRQSTTSASGHDDTLQNIDQLLSNLQEQVGTMDLKKSQGALAAAAAAGSSSNINNGSEYSPAPAAKSRAIAQSTPLKNMVTPAPAPPPAFQSQPMGNQNSNNMEPRRLPAMGSDGQPRDSLMDEIRSSSPQLRPVPAGELQQQSELRRSKEDLLRGPLQEAIKDRRDKVQEVPTEEW